MSKFRKISTGGSYGDWLTAKVQLKPDKVRIVPLEDDGTEDIANAVVVARKNVPENLFEGKHNVKLAEDKKSIVGFSPYSGQYPAKFIGFASKKDEPPAPKSNTSPKTGGTYLTFTPRFEIVDGDYKGVEVAKRLYYNFMEVDNTVALRGTGKSTEEVEEFFDSVIGQFDPPPWRDNILPGLQKLAFQAKRTILLTFKKGFIIAIEAMEGTAKPNPKKDDNPPWEQEPDTE